MKKEKKIPVAEIFYSIQGEQQGLGNPSIFLRVSGCNLRCKWCDTKYSWQKGKLMTFEEIEEKIEEIINSQFSGFSRGMIHLVITGGEPLLYQKEITSLLKRIKNNFYSVTIETNGTIKPYKPLMKLVDFWNVSPKLSNSGNEKKKRKLNKRFLYMRNVIFKFVVRGVKDVIEIMNDFPYESMNIFLMPKGKKFNIERERKIVEICKKYGFCFSPRYHIILYGNQRGR